MDLTDKGRKLVKRFLADNTAIDISHLNSRSRKSLLSMGHRVCATHCNAARLCSGRNRNLPDEDLTEIAGNGGVIGVTFVPDFLTDQKGMATIESVVDHVEYIAERTSTDSVGFGSDFDGIRELPAGITGAESWYRVIDALETGLVTGGHRKVACGTGFDFQFIEYTEVSFEVLSTFYRSASLLGGCPDPLEFGIVQDLVGEPPG